MRTSLGRVLTLLLVFYGKNILIVKFTMSAFFIMKSFFSILNNDDENVTFLSGNVDSGNLEKMHMVNEVCW